MKLLLFCLSFTFVTNVFSQFSGPLKFSKKESFNGVKSIVSDEYAVWIGTEEGIKRLEVQLDSVVAISERRTSKPVLSLLNEKKVLWVGIQSKGVYLFDKKTYQFTGKFKKQLGKSDVILIERKRGRLAFYTANGKSFEMSQDSTLQLISDSIQVDLRPNMSAEFKENIIQIIANNLFFSNQNEQVDAPKTAINSTDTLMVVNSPDTMDGLLAKGKVDSSLIKEKQGVEEKEGLSPVASIKCQESYSGLWYMGISAFVVSYSLLLYFLIARKFKKDIRVLEDQLLEEIKKK